MIQFETQIHQFGEMGEKTGWKYIEIPIDLADQLNPSVRKSYRVKGSLDAHKINGVAMIPMGGGVFIIPINATMRKALKKNEGAMLRVVLEVDKELYQLNKMLVGALELSEQASKSFYKMPRSHQNYYSKWIESAKLVGTQEKRIVQVVLSLEKGLSFAEMLREQAAQKKLLG